MSGTGGTPLFGFPSNNGGSSFDYLSNNQQPKSPKSPKATLENPLLKNPYLHMMDGNGNAPPSLMNEQQHQRTPLVQKNANQRNDTPHHRVTNKRMVQSTPGPPPKASLSLMSLDVTLTPAPSEAATAFTSPMTPPPVASPALLAYSKEDNASSAIPSLASTTTTHQQQKQHLMMHRQQQVPLLSSALENDSSMNSYTTNNWVVAFGFTDRQERNELLDLLASHGPLVQTHTNGNWLAVQYATQIPAAKALCNQPIRLSSSSTLCGTCRVSPSLLQSLLSQPPPTMSSSSSNNNGVVDNNHQKADNGNNVASGSMLREYDILASYHGAGGDDNDDDNEDIMMRRPTSVCDKIMDWYFGWDYYSKPKIE